MGVGDIGVVQFCSLVDLVGFSPPAGNNNRSHCRLCPGKAHPRIRSVVLCGCVYRVEGSHTYNLSSHQGDLLAGSVVALSQLM